jgi:hypothetical protein
MWMDTRLSSAMYLSILDLNGSGDDLIRQAVADLRPGDRI